MTRKRGFVPRDYDKRTPKQQVRTAMYDRDLKIRRLGADLEALADAIEKRPLVPPHRRNK
jgi:hypothetical protein